MPIKLPATNDAPLVGQWATVSGFGAWCDRQVDPLCSQKDTFGGTDRVRSVYVTIQTCMVSVHKSAPEISKCYPNGYVCAGGEQVDAGVHAKNLTNQLLPYDACSGDSGGPLECFNEIGERYLCGIVAFGSGPPNCGSNQGAYTRVAHPTLLAFLSQAPDIRDTVKTDWITDPQNFQAPNRSDETKQNIACNHELIHYHERMILMALYNLINGYLYFNI
ncbi:kallikrein-13-like [Symsagittifera roscoffensis]|uniref:kallikrein-13-like n=1 Tax=Symsagittifera roscoffensis TaxID=84072 RepID=UPI00307B9127